MTPRAHETLRLLAEGVPLQRRQSGFWVFPANSAFPVHVPPTVALELLKGRYVAISNGSRATRYTITAAGRAALAWEQNG